MKITISKRAGLYLLTTVLLLSEYQYASAQEKEVLKKSEFNVYGEVSSIGLISTLLMNAEYTMARNEKGTQFNARFGLGYGQYALGYGGTGALLGLSVVKGTGKNHFEFSTGVFMGSDDTGGGDGTASNSFLIPIIDVGYRYHKSDGGWLFKAKAGISGIGVGLGYAF